MHWVSPHLRRCGALLLAIVLLEPSCDSSSACTELDCVSEATVTFPPNLVSGAYDLVLEGQTETAAARCLDPAEAANNPEGITCDATGFKLVGHPLANAREVVVTIIPDGADEADQVSEPVRLDAIEEVTPNGPDCPPLCVIRNGQLRLSGV